MKNNFTSRKILICLGLILAASCVGIFADEGKIIPSVNSIEELELPLRQKNYGEYYDDFNRLVGNEIRKEAKELYVEQQAENVITDLKEAAMPLIKASNIGDFYNKYYYYDCYDYSDYDCDVSEFEAANFRVSFYDYLGRRISDDLLLQANKLYEKQKRKRAYSVWGSSTILEIGHYIWLLIKILIIVALCTVTFGLIFRKVVKNK